MHSLDTEERKDLLESIALSRSAYLAMCPVAEIDVVSVSSLKELCGAEGADCAGWYLLHEDSHTVEQFTSVHDYGLLDKISNFNSMELPWCQSRLMRGQAVLLTRVTELPPEAEGDRFFLESLGVHSLALLPIDAGDSCRSLLTILSLARSNAWSNNLAKQGALLGRAILSAQARKSIHQQKAYSDSNFQTIFRSASVGIVIESATGGLLHANPAFCSMLGYTETEMIGKRCTEFSHPADYEREKALFKQLSTNHLQSYEIEKRFWHRNGKIVYAKVNVTRLLHSSTGSELILGIAEDVTAQKVLMDRLTISQTEVQSLASRLIVSQEEERRGIARELHDDIGQRLSMITSEMHLLKTDCDFESSEKKTALERLSEELDTLVTDLHNVSYRLHSSKLQHLGIRSSLHRLCQRLAHSGLCVDLTVGEEIESVPDDIAICLFRVAQEALSNVLKYSGATCAILTLTRKRGRYFMAIKDSGKGFDMDACPRGLGLISITERVRLLHGEVAISSCHEHGTEIALWIPSTAANLRVGKKLGPVAESARGKAALNY